MSDGPLKYTPKSIWTVRQGKLTRIVNDLAWRVNRESEIYQVLLNRGVFKWFAVRRGLYRLRAHLKDVIKHCEQESAQIRESAQITFEDSNRIMWLKGYKQAMVDSRRELKTLLTGERWQVQDNDRKAQKWLKEQEDALKAKIILHEESKLG